MKPVSTNTYQGINIKIQAMTNRLITNVFGGVDVKYEEDWTIIPVKVRSEDTLKVIESGIIVEEYTRCEMQEDDFDESDEWREREANDCS